LPDDLDAIPVEPVDGLQLTREQVGLAGECPIPSDDYRACVDERKLLVRLARGAVANVVFGDLCGLAEALGFELRRVSGSHHVFSHPDIPELVNLQSVRGQAKPYQVRQLMRLVERYDLRLEDRP
jgi:predicted RNA binding protein YcfA (HicA-like mRNA interferase family)